MKDERKSPYMRCHHISEIWPQYQKYGTKISCLTLVAGCLSACDAVEDVSSYCAYEGQTLTLSLSECESVGGDLVTDTSPLEKVLQEPKPVAIPRGDVSVRFMSIQELKLPETQE